MSILRNKRLTGGRLGLTVAGKDHWADMIEIELSPETKDKDILTFADALGGAVANWKLKGKAIISTAAQSFWMYVWENTGKTVDFILAPHGNKEATTEEPHFVGKVKIGARPPIGKKASEEKGAEFDFEWELEGEPKLTTTESTLGTNNVEEATAG